MSDYGIRTKVMLPHTEVLARTKEALQAEGFGVLSEIDIAEKLREKLGVDFKKYVILGACNPPLAYKALKAEPEVGLLLPCNVIVYDADEGGTVVSAVDRDSMLGSVRENAAMAEVARDARARLERVIATVGRAV